MLRHPIESNFYVSVSDTEIEVTFAPTRSVYTFSRVTSESTGMLADPAVHHLGKKGNTGDYKARRFGHHKAPALATHRHSALAVREPTG
jgi:hypothetical protein